MPLRKEDFVIHLARCVAKGVDPKAIALPILETEIPGFTDRMDMEYFLSKSEASVKKHECKASAPALSKESDSTLAEIGRLKSSSEEIRQDLFVEYGKSLSLLLGQIDQHPNGLYPYSIINMVYFYIDIIMPLYEADIRRRLYPEMGVLMTHALSINFDNSLLTAHHFVLDSDKHRLADYIQFLKTKSSSNNKTVLFYNEGAKRFDLRHIDMINSVATMLLNDIDVEPSLRSLPIFEKITTRCFMDFGDKKILGTKEQLEAYKQHLTLQVKMHNTMNSLAPAMSSLSNGSLFTDPSLNGYWPGRHFPAQYNFSNPLSSVSQASFEEWAITSGRITPKLELDIVDAVVAIEEISRKLSQKGDSKSSSDLSSILQFKYENVQSLMLNIITLFGDEDKYKELLLSNYSEGGLLVCFNNYSLHYHGFGAETKELLNRFFAVAGQDARLQNNLLYFVSKSLDQSIDNIKNPKFKAYQENMGLFLESVIEYNYLYCFTSTDGAFPIVDLFYNMKLFPKQRDLLCQTINDVRARDLDFSANPNIMHIKYNILLNKGSDSIYSQVLKTSPEIKWLFDRIVFIKISKELPSINLSQIAKMGNYIDITIESADINEVNRFLETILNVQNYQRVRDLFFRTTTDAQGNEKSCLTNYFSTRFYKLLIKDSESAIKLIAVAFNEGGKDGKPHALKEYYLKQTFIHLLGRKKYSMLNSLYNLEPDLFSSYLTSDAKLRNISDKHFEALDNESLKSSITK
ncbi:MAG: hypothetical protein HOM96_05605, partial [Rickettsiales bacterium]|nr:hypothetical protein [Rickettsiales bacterium]